MEKIGLFFGSDTGCTEGIVQKVTEILGEELVDVHEMCDVRDTALFYDYNYILIGVPTWYDGDLQSDWDDFLEQFETIDFTGKTVAIFGLGDQIGYEEFFVDGIGILGTVVMNNGGELVGAWPTDEYEFEASQAVFEHEGDLYFMGLALDEDNQEDMTDERLKNWLAQVMEEFGFELAVNEE